MDIQIRGRNIELTQALKDYAEKHVEKFYRYVDAKSIQVILSVHNSRHVAEITVVVKDSIILRAEETSETMYASIDLAIEKIERQIRRYKTKTLKKRQESRIEPTSDFDKTEPSNEEINFVRTKRFSIKPMTSEEAVLQMELSMHDFFIYKNAETNQFEIVYSRKKGHYGLIELE